MSEPARLRPPRSQTSAPKLTKRPRPSSSSSGAEARSSTQSKEAAGRRGSSSGSGHGPESRNPRVSPEDGGRGYDGSSSNRDKSHLSYPNGGGVSHKRDHHQSYGPHLSVKKARIETYDNDTQSYTNSYSKGGSASKSSSSVRLKTNSSYNGGGRGQDGSSEGRGGAHSRYGGSSEKGGKGSSGGTYHTEKGSKKGHGYKGSSHGKEKGGHGRHATTWWKENSYGAHSRWAGGSTHGSHVRDKGKEPYGKGRRREERTYRDGDVYWNKKDGEKDYESRRDEGKSGGDDFDAGWYPGTEEDDNNYGADTNGKSTSYCANNDEHDGTSRAGGGDGDRSTSIAALREGSNSNGNNGNGEKRTNDDCANTIRSSPSTTAGGAHQERDTTRDEASHPSEDKNGLHQGEPRVEKKRSTVDLTEREENEKDDPERVLSNNLFSEALIGGDEEDITNNKSKKQSEKEDGKRTEHCRTRERRESKREKEAREMHHHGMGMPSSTSSRHDSRSLPFFPRSPSKERGGKETELKACVTAVHELANSWKFGVEFLMSWNKTKKYSETELYEALQDFVEESKKKPEYSHLARFHPTVISVRSLIQTLELVDMHVRKLAGPEEELRVVTKSKLCTCIIRVIGHAAMFADLDIDLRGPHENSSLRRNMIGESIQVQRHRRAAEALVEKCNLAMKNEREWIPKAAVRMCNAYARDAYSVGQRSMEIIKKRNKSSSVVLGGGLGDRGGGSTSTSTSNPLPSTTQLPLVKDDVIEAENDAAEEKEANITSITNKTDGDKDGDVTMNTADGDKDVGDVAMNSDGDTTLVIKTPCANADDGSKTEEKVSSSAVEGETDDGGNAHSDAHAEKSEKADIIKTDDIINAPDQGTKEQQHTQDDEKMDDVINACEENAAPSHTTLKTQHIEAEKDKDEHPAAGESVSSAIIITPAVAAAGDVLPPACDTAVADSTVSVSPLLESEEGFVSVRDAYSLPLECASEDEREGLLVDEEVENEGGVGAEEVDAVEEGEGAEEVGAVVEGEGAVEVGAVVEGEGIVEVGAAVEGKLVAEEGEVVAEGAEVADSVEQRGGDQ